MCVLLRPSFERLWPWRYEVSMVDSYRFLGGAANSSSFLTAILLPARSGMRPAAELPLQRNVAKEKRARLRGFKAVPS